MFLFLFLSLISQTSTTYQDSIARSKFFPAAAAAYADNPSLCLSSQFPNATLKRKVSVLCDIVDTCSGFTAVSHSDRAIIISYRGTNSNFQLLEDVWGTLVESHVNWAAGGWVAHYFYNGFNLLWTKGIKDDFFSLTNRYPDYQLWITGHSLGATFAILTGSYIAHNNIFDPTRISVLTFGEPRIGDHQFAASINAELPNTIRVVHAKDVVAHEPTMDHHGGFYHHFTEVWYPVDMGINSNFIICSDAAESKNCSDGQTDHSFDDHMHYFNTQIEIFGRNNCKQQ